MGHPKGFGKVALGGTGQVSDSGWKAPRLAKALLEAPVATADTTKTSLEKDITAGMRKKVTLGSKTDYQSELAVLCDHIQARAKIGLDEAWISASGYNFPDVADIMKRANVPNLSPDAITKLTAEYEDFADALIFYNAGEERWARAFCEKFLFSAYGGVGQTHGYGQNDEPLFLEFPTVHPIVVACQHVSSYAILSRGVPLTEIQKSGITGCSCSGGVIGYDAFDKAISQKKPMKSPAPTVDEEGKPLTYKQQQEKLKELGNAGQNTGAPAWANAKELTKLGITPGSVVSFNGGGFDYTGQDVNVGTTHSAVVLRVSGERIQFIDTGVVIGDDEAGTGEAGTVDHSFLSGSLAAQDSVVAVGVLKDCSKTLTEFAEKTMNARPLGLTRLVVVETASKQVLFVSKLLHMRWPVSQLIWSLRGLPTEGLTVAWLVYVTDTKAGTALLLQKPTDAPASFLDATGVSLDLMNVIVSDGSDLNVYRHHNSGTWRRNFSSNKDKDPGDAETWTLEVDTSKPLLKWCLERGGFGKRFLREPGEKKGAFDNGTVGSTLVDP
ncbi:Hypothetical protein A7982_01381 [Minicystis rosea]|nr:Hypothetical protein A7982_01381 [Minicystis rosea]